MKNDSNFDLAATTESKYERKTFGAVGGLPNNLENALTNLHQRHIRFGESRCVAGNFDPPPHNQNLISDD